MIHFLKLLYHIFYPLTKNINKHFLCHMIKIFKESPFNNDTIIILALLNQLSSRWISCICYALINNRIVMTVVYLKAWFQRICDELNSIEERKVVVHVELILLPIDVGDRIRCLVLNVVYHHLHRVEVAEVHPPFLTRDFKSD